MATSFRLRASRLASVSFLSALARLHLALAAALFLVSGGPVLTGPTLSYAELVDDVDADDDGIENDIDEDDHDEEEESES
jgi:hypothetical protein